MRSVAGSPPATLRATLNQALSAVASMANVLYLDDEAALLSSGFNLSKAPERHTTLDAPLKFQLVDGASADRVYCKVAAVGDDTDQQPYTDTLLRLVQ